jgi:DNA-binding NarL/FixJ family response regulator
VVLADDHDVVRRGLAMVLEAESEFCVVGEARNGQEAIEVAVRLRPDLVLLDVKMPVLDGVQAAKLIKHEAPREIDILRLMATSHTNREIASQLFVSEETVRTHVKHILRKLAQPDRTQAVIAAVRAGLLDIG